MIVRPKTMLNPFEEKSFDVFSSSIKIRCI